MIDSDDVFNRNEACHCLRCLIIFVTEYRYKECMENPIKIFLSFSLINMQNSVAVFHTVWAYV